MSRNFYKRTSVAVISGAVLLMLGLGGCNRIQSSDHLLAEAKQYQQKGDNKAAIIQLKNALQKDPNSKEARYLLGKLYVETGDAVSAEKELDKAVSLGMDAATVLPSLAKTLLLKGEFQKVLDKTAQDPRATTDADFASIRGDALLSLGKFSEAKAAYEYALKAQADYPDAMLGLAKHAYASKDLETANQFAEQTISKHPKDARAWLFKGDLMRIQNHLDAALAAYTETIKIQPENITALIVRANLEIGMKKFQEAQKDIDATKKISPSSVLAIYTQALLDFYQGKHKNSLESLQQVLHLAPEYLPAILLSGAVEYAQGSVQQAEQHLRKFLGRNPDNPYARKLLAATLLKTGQAEKALPEIEAALKITPEDSQLLAMAGEANILAKNFVKAAEYFEKASTLTPDAAEYRTALGMTKLGLGDTDHAIADLEKATNLNEKSPKAGVLLIMTHVQQKEYDKALAVAARLEKEQSSNPLIPNLKGGIYLYKKDNANARTNFEKAVSIQPTFFPAIANLARMDVKENKPEAAKKRLEALLEKDKKNLPAMTALASLAVARNNNEEAKAWLERAYNDNPDALQPTQLLAAQYLKMGEKQKALTLVKKAQTTNQKSPEFMALLARTQMSVEDKAGALDSYGRLAAMLPESPAAQLQVATIQLAMGDDAGAMDNAKKALRLDAKFADAQLILASLLVKKSQFDEALNIARQIQKQNDKSPSGYVMEGDIFLAQKKPVPAVKSYEFAQKINPQSPIIAKIHSALLQDGKAKEADTKITQWLKEHPEDNATRLYLGMRYLQDSKSRLAAIEQFQEILKTEPKNPVVLNNLAWAYGEEKDKRALEYAEKALQIAPNNAGVMDTAGWLYAEQGNTAKALSLLQKASAIVPDAQEIRYHLALTLAKSGDKQKARKELELVVNGKNFNKMEEARTTLKQW